MTAPAVTFRPATADDVDAILGLWQRGGVEHDPETDRDEISTKLDFDGDLFLVADRDGQVVASVMGTYDGHRGRIKRCVVDPSEQGTGIGRAMVNELERRFLERGITELRLEVWADNTAGQKFWASMGWDLLDDVLYYTRRLS